MWRLHNPVMVNEVLQLFQPKFKKVFLDMTFGGGGHSKYLLDSNPENIVYGLDQDPLAYKIAQKFEKDYNGRFYALQGKFSNIDSLLPKNIKYDGILIDLGCSSMQFDKGERGFSLNKIGPLNMRMDNDNNYITAHDIVNLLSEINIKDILIKYGEEMNASFIAKAIIDARNFMKIIETTVELNNKVKRTLFKLDKLGRNSHVATKTFQALRAFINDEYNQIEIGLLKLNDYLKTTLSANHSFHKFRSSHFKRQILSYNQQNIVYNDLQPDEIFPPLLIVLSFHSLEDRLVKHRFHNQQLSQENQDKLNYQPESHRKWVPFNKYVIEPSKDEVHNNPRSRSAKLRSAYLV
ncbi:12S rRNA N4-methylcytidine methyltransferase-like isoform X3 [Gordionus sp. m RMFG-2023]|uniref:12S rRNA N4-methylcytidine methyltransferase-like isoform X3 n=1 Tax=Gordionus sp. m RMFG-2023 TaxID=3053472 RepID=UPI0031FE073E